MLYKTGAFSLSGRNVHSGYEIPDCAPGGWPVFFFPSFQRVTGSVPPALPPGGTRTGRIPFLLLFFLLSLLASNCVGIEHAKNPTADGQEITVNEDSTVSITLTGSDPEDDPLAWEVLEGPFHGSIIGTLPYINYIPDTDYFGPDSFTFRATDGFSYSHTASVLITVIPVNDPPTATSARIITHRNTTSNGVTPTVEDVDIGDSFTFAILTQPSLGSAFIQTDQLYYEPDPDISGSDKFTYRAFDSAGKHVDGTASVTIVGDNTAPSAVSQSVVVDEDNAASIILKATDADGDALSYIIVSGPSNGTLSGAPPGLTYLPALNYNGADSFTFMANDGTSDSNTATVSITVDPVNDPPTGTGAAVSTQEDTPSPGVTPWVVDVDTGDSYAFTVLSQPAHGAARVTANQLVYEPAPDFNGSDSFTFRAVDSGGLHADGTAAVTVAPVNDPPTATNARITTEEDVTSPGVTPTVADVDSGDSFIFSVLTQPASGTAYAQSNMLYYQPAPDISGSYSFTYRAFDSGNAYVDGTAAVSVTPVNDAPVAESQTVTAYEDIETPILLTGSDIEGDALTYAIVSGPSHGAILGTPPEVTYLSATDYNGPDSFTFSASDGALQSVPATVQITVSPRLDIWFVDADAAGAADGKSWPDAFNHPQDALSVAGAGDQIWVAEGVYGPSGSDGLVIAMIDGILLYGGFDGTETALSGRDFNVHITVLDGENSADGVSGAANARLDGFTITRARQNGMRNSGVSPTVVNCIFEDNGLVEGLDGGAIQNVASANALISSTVFLNNFRSAIYNENSSPTISGCSFYGNSSDSGGAIKNSGANSQPYIAHSLFDGNAASVNGGAVSSSASNPLVENCVFTGNKAGGNGGALYNDNGATPNVINSLFTGNSAGQMGGAVYSNDSHPGIINCSLYANTAAEHGGVATEKGHGGGARVINSILWANSELQVYDGPSSKTVVANSDVQGQDFGTGNISLDPAFVDPAAGDLRLAPGSPCIDTGDNGSVTTPYDLDDRPRIVDGNSDGTAVVDMGAYEFAP